MNKLLSIRLYVLALKIPYSNSNSAKSVVFIIIPCPCGYIPAGRNLLGARGVFRITHALYIQYYIIIIVLQYKTILLSGGGDPKRMRYMSSKEGVTGKARSHESAVGGGGVRALPQKIKTIHALKCI